MNNFNIEIASAVHSFTFGLKYTRVMENYNSVYVNHM
jgi:hypothetical protein